MSVRRVLLFIVGTLIGGVILMFLLPFIGIPPSHVLPPSRVYATAQGETRGAVVSKYYKETSNPFHVGDHLYYVTYEFKAPAPPPRGVPIPGPKQTYTGTVSVDKGTYDEFALPDSEKNTTFKSGEVITLAPFAVKVKYEKTDPEINGLLDSWANGARSILGASNIVSGWIVWLVVALFLGWLLMMGLERFGKQEDL